jgi:integrase
VAKKRQRGSGTVYPRKNKEGKVTSYLGSYFTPDGKRRYVSAKTKTSCREKLRQAMSDTDRGLVFESGTLILGQYLAKWLPSIKDTVRQRTYERYESIVRVHIKPALGRVKLRALTPTHLRFLYRDKLDVASLCAP